MEYRSFLLRAWPVTLAVLILIMFWRGWQGSIVEVKEAVYAVIFWQLLGAVGIGIFKALKFPLAENHDIYAEFIIL
jgi:hypothetical protein